MRLLCLAIAMLFASGLAESAAAGLQKSTVFFAADSYVLPAHSQPSAPIVRRMVDSLLLAATGKSSVAEAWRSLVGPTDVVGIKVAASAGAIAGTHPAVLDAVVDGLLQAGVRNIIVWDRNREDLLAAGFRERSSNYTLKWIDPATGYDREATITAPVLGKLIWGDSRFGDRKGLRIVDRLSGGDQLSNLSYWATVLSKQVTKVINIPSLTDSYLTGLNGAIANMSLSNIDNWRRFTTPPEHGNPYLAEMYADPMIAGKVVITMMDGLVLQFAGGPFPNPNFTRPNYTLYASFDPVAIDATAIRLLDDFRVANKLPRIEEAAGHVKSAAAIGLGRYDEAEIDLIPVRTGGGF